MANRFNSGHSSPYESHQSAIVNTIFDKDKTKIRHHRIIFDKDMEKLKLKKKIPGVFLFLVKIAVGNPKSPLAFLNASI